MNDVNKTSKKTGLSVDLLNFLMVTTDNDKGNAFASIRNYYSKTSKETANHKVNLAFNYVNAQKKDFAMLKEINLDTFYPTFKELLYKSIQNKIDYLTSNGATQKTINHFNAKLNEDCTKEIMLSAFETVYNSFIYVGQTLYNGNPKLEKTNSQKGQINAYESINGSVKFHIATETIMLKCKFESKDVLIKGKLKETHNGLKVLAQDVFRQGFKSTKYRNYIVSRSEFINAYKRKFKGLELEMNEIGRAHV